MRCFSQANCMFLDVVDKFYIFVNCIRDYPCQISEWAIDLDISGNLERVLTSLQCVTLAKDWKFAKKLKIKPEDTVDEKYCTAAVQVIGYSRSFDKDADQMLQKSITLYEEMINSDIYKSYPYGKRVELEVLYYVSNAWAYWSQNEHEVAISLMKNASNIEAYASPPIIIASENMGEMLYIEENYEEALEEYMKALDQYPLTLNNLYGVAMCYQKLYQANEALPYFKSLLELCNTEYTSKCEPEIEGVCQGNYEFICDQREEFAFAKEFVEKFNSGSSDIYKYLFIVNCLVLLVAIGAVLAIRFAKGSKNTYSEV
eukprot:TRINITY_DN2480_c0_g1_i3.p1 TRINITY_DN2480_c0_g1~~TRINITY_DN2480_c0_g1_i3.p1  ORF type:complete len:315 (+),score=64.71 TRINITY_DN2480_c0_g1_i3:1007-1951(+)